MIQVRAENTLSIHLINESDSEVNDIRSFTNFIKTCRDEANKPGFTNMFRDDERNIIRMIAEQILPKKDDIVNIHADRSTIKNEYNY